MSALPETTIASLSKNREKSVDPVLSPALGAPEVPILVSASIAGPDVSIPGDGIADSEIPTVVGVGDQKGIEENAEREQEGDQGGDREALVAIYKRLESRDDYHIKLKAFQVKNNPHWRELTDDIIIGFENAVHELKVKDFYVWTREPIRDALGRETWQNLTHVLKKHQHYDDLFELVFFYYKCEINESRQFIIMLDHTSVVFRADRLKSANLEGGRRLLHSVSGTEEYGYITCGIDEGAGEAETVQDGTTKRVLKDLNEYHSLDKLIEKEMSEHRLSEKIKGSDFDTIVTLATLHDKQLTLCEYLAKLKDRMYSKTRTSKLAPDRLPKDVLSHDVPGQKLYGEYKEAKENAEDLGEKIARLKNVLELISKPSGLTLGDELEVKTIEFELLKLYDQIRAARALRQGISKSLELATHEQTTAGLQSTELQRQVQQEKISKLKTLFLRADSRVKQLKWDADKVIGRLIAVGGMDRAKLDLSRHFGDMAPKTLGWIQGRMHKVSKEDPLNSSSADDLSLGKNKKQSVKKGS